MRAAVLFLLLSLFTPDVCDERDPPGKDARPAADRAKAVEKEIADLQARLATLQKELATLRPLRITRKHLRPWELDVGQVGNLNTSTAGGQTLARDMRVVEVLGDREMVVCLDGNRAVQMLLVTPEAKGKAEGRLYQTDAVWHVKETRKVGGRTLYVLEDVSATVVREQVIEPTKKADPSRKGKKKP